MEVNGIDEAAIAELCASWDSGVGQTVAEVTERVHAAAIAMAPASARGSKYAPPGYLKTRIAAAYKHDAAGQVLGLVGIPLHAGSRYPYPFISNEKGSTINRGHRSRRAAVNAFLLRALAAAG